MARQSKSDVLLTIRSTGVARIILLTILGLVGSWLAASLAISGVTRIKAPQAALAAMPNDGIALASRADQIFFSNSRNPPREAEMLARRALKNQAINAKALRVLGYVADAKGDTEMAEKYVRMSAKLSRREAGAQLWLMEASARNGDSAQTLIHYDIALRTKPETQAILFPRLLTAIDDPEVRQNLKPYIRQQNSWVAPFLFFANSNSNNLPALVSLIQESGGLLKRDTARDQVQGLLSRLIAEGYFPEARNLYLEMRGAQAWRLTNAAFDSSDRDGRFGSIGWLLFDDPDAGGGFHGEGRQTRLSVFANSSTTRPVATKLLYLQPGEYLFAAHLANLNRGDGGFLRWQLRCPSSNGQAVWSVNSINKQLRAELTIPANCPVQFLDIIASGGKGQTGLEATIASVSLAPAN